MKALTIHHPLLGTCLVQISPHVDHSLFLQALGNPKYQDAGFVTLPEGVTPKYVGFSSSLNSGPSPLGQKLLEAGTNVTREMYPHASLFDSTINA